MEEDKEIIDYLKKRGFKEIKNKPGFFECFGINVEFDFSNYEARKKIANYLKQN